MSELRQDPISGRWVIIAQNRAQRPNEFTHPAGDRIQSRCPFCLGNETDTPHEIATYTDPNDSTASWQVRIVPNKYPAVEDNGVHDVVIESPQHVASFSEVSPLQAKLTFAAYRDRLQVLSQHPHLAYCHIFKNAGAWAGASIEHAHSQILGMQIIPSQIQCELDHTSRYHHEHGNCLFCQMLSDELLQKARLIAQSPHFVAFCPFAPRFPYETWILPRQHAAQFELIELSLLGELSSLVQSLIAAVETVTKRVEYNYYLHTAPFNTSRFDIASSDHYHWHIELFPRLTHPAGFEWGTDCFINPVSPEQAAESLRQARSNIDL